MSKPVVIRLTAPLRARLEAEAARRGVSMSEVIRGLLEVALPPALPKVDPRQIDLNLDDFGPYRGQRLRRHG